MSIQQLGKVDNGIKFLTIDDLISINKTLIEVQTANEPICVKDRNLLESSQHRPYHYRLYHQTEDVFILSSVLTESIIKNHPFANANKRTGMYSSYIFLLLNGWELYAPEDGFVEMGEGIALKKYSKEDLESWLCLWSRKYDTHNLNITHNFNVEKFLKRVYPKSTYF